MKILLASPGCSSGFSVKQLAYKKINQNAVHLHLQIYFWYCSRNSNVVWSLQRVSIGYLSLAVSSVTRIIGEWVIKIFFIPWDRSLN